MKTVSDYRILKIVYFTICVKECVVKHIRQYTNKKSPSGGLFFYDLITSTAIISFQADRFLRVWKYVMPFNSDMLTSSRPTSSRRFATDLFVR